jgi:hypothetical protein
LSLRLKPPAIAKVAIAATTAPAATAASARRVVVADMLRGAFPGRPEFSGWGSAPFD